MWKYILLCCDCPPFVYVISNETYPILLGTNISVVPMKMCQFNSWESVEERVFILETRKEAKELLLIFSNAGGFFDLMMHFILFSFKVLKNAIYKCHIISKSETASLEDLKFISLKKYLIKCKYSCSKTC